MVRVGNYIGAKAFWVDAVFGLLPMATWIAVVFYTLQQEWLKEHAALTLVLMTPSYCLINSKLIVCCFTGMEPETFANNFAVYSLFELNKIMYGSAPEGRFTDWQVAIVVFAIECTAYLVFVFCTISQITHHLNIHCLSIKPSDKSTRSQKSV
mmetsp:Transcript_16456/g.22255  ORF Transcript_16456/g.22255 Transcript_16456/m.22255 type:complete len:153 (-) Transcript_16456:132-590(-)